MNDNEKAVLFPYLDQAAIDINNVNESYLAITRILKIVTRDEILNMEIAACLRLTVDLVKHHSKIVQMFNPDTDIMARAERVEENIDQVITEML